MATLNSTNVQTGNTIESNDILQLYDAFTSGGGTTGAYYVSISGSLTGLATSASFVTGSIFTSANPALTASFAMTSSLARTASFVQNAQTASFVTLAQTASFIQNAQTASFVNPLDQSVTITGSFTTSGSRIRNYRTLTLTNADYSLFPSPSILSNDDIVLIIDNTTSSPSVGESNLDITNLLNSTAGRCVEIVNVKEGTGGGIVISTTSMAGGLLMLNNVSVSNGTRKINPLSGNSVTLMSQGLPVTGSIWGNGI